MPTRTRRDNKQQKEIRAALEGIGIRLAKIGEQGGLITILAPGQPLTVTYDCPIHDGVGYYDAEHWVTDGRKLYDPNRSQGDIVDATFAICYYGSVNWAYPTQLVVRRGWDIGEIAKLAPPRIPTIGG